MFSLSLSLEEFLSSFNFLSQSQNQTMTDLTAEMIQEICNRKQTVQICDSKILVSSSTVEFQEDTKCRTEQTLETETIDEETGVPSAQEATIFAENYQFEY